MIRSLPLAGRIGPSLALRVRKRAIHDGWRYIVRSLALLARIIRQWEVGNRQSTLYNGPGLGGAYGCSERFSQRRRWWFCH